MGHALFGLVLIMTCCLWLKSSGNSPSDQSDAQGYAKPQMIRTRITTKPCYQYFVQKEAYCNKRHLDHVPDYLNPDIQVLDLQYNNIKTLYNSSFMRYPLLLKLNLRNNDIHVIQPGALYPLRYLRRLDLSENVHLQFLDGDIFQWSSNLTRIWIHRCNLAYIPENTIKWLPNLKQLSLWRNRLSAINITHCPILDARLSICLGYNPIFMLTTETLNIHCKLLVLDITAVQFNIVDPLVFARIQAESFIFDVLNNYSTEAIESIFSGIAHSKVNKVIIRFFDDQRKIHLPLKGDLRTICRYFLYESI